jgi:hypothetical protein
VRPTSVTSSWGPVSPWAAFRPPKPPPTITTRCRSAIAVPQLEIRDAVVVQHGVNAEDLTAHPARGVTETETRRAAGEGDNLHDHRNARPTKEGLRHEGDRGNSSGHVLEQRR